MRPRRSVTPLVLGCLALLFGCDEPSRAANVRAKRELKAEASATRKEQPAKAAPRPTSADALSVSRLPDAEPAAAPSAATNAASKLIIDAAQEIGPAGQMTATERGVVMLNRSDEVLFAKRGPLASGAHSGTAQFSHVPGGANDFFAVARGPLVLRGYAYWVREGKLVRRALDNATPLQVLANDARNGTRVVAADWPGVPAHALYISNPQSTADDAPPRARLWVEGAETVTVSPEGAGASSVAAASAGPDLFAIAIDARSAMTPLHGRRVHFNAGKPELDADVVMWVGSTSQTLSEVFATTTPFGVRAFLPIERDISHFGLVMLDLGNTPHMDPKTTWRAYPNGLDVAPVASSALCDSAFVAYVRPETADPESRQVLEIAEISELGLGPAQVVDHALGFANISLGSATNSAILAYVADFRTFATTLRCTHKR